MSGTAISAGASAMALSASTMEVTKQRKRQECKSAMNGFHDEAATQNQKVEYAKCVLKYVDTQEVQSANYTPIIGAIAIVFAVILVWRKIFC